MADLFQRKGQGGIKVDPHGRDPLPLRLSNLQVGDTVLAIGAPLDPKLQGTVTRGVVSATSRIMDGYRFIQSDVGVNHGNSGGPLLDDKGYVVGLTAGEGRGKAEKRSVSTSSPRSRTPWIS